MTGTPPTPDSGANRTPKPADGGINPSQFAGAGIEFAVCIIIGLYAGQYIDKKLGTAPWLLIVGVFLGAGLGFYSMYRKLTAAQARDDAARKARREGTG